MRLLQRQNLIFFFCCLLMACMIYSLYLLSVSMIALAVLSIFEKGDGWSLRWDRKALSRLRRLNRYPHFLVFGLFFFIVLLSFWQTYDLHYWLARLRIKVPFLLLPLVFIALPRFSERQVQHLLYVLLWILLLSSLAVGVHYLLNYEEIMLRIKQGQPIPTPGNHIRFSLLLAYGILGGAYLIRQNYFSRYRWERAVVAIITGFLFLFIHFLSVRTGIAALYAGLLMFVIHYIASSGNHLRALAILAVMVAMPVIGYRTIPSFRAKVDYMRWDWKMFREGKGADYADSGRLVSLKVGYELFREHPVFGVGAGNLRAEVERKFEEQYPQFTEPLVPHNQFLFVLAGTGMAGLTIFLFAWLFPLFYRQRYRRLMLLSFYGLIFAAFMLEHTLENSVGAAYYCFFTLLWLNHLRE